MMRTCSLLLSVWQYDMRRASGSERANQNAAYKLEMRKTTLMHALSVRTDVSIDRSDDSITAPQYYYYYYYYYNRHTN
eukprot:13065-Heterococcus_DN1.PRE.4